MRKSTRYVGRAKRLEWLRNHRHLWEGLDLSKSNNRMRQSWILRQMKLDGVMAPSTNLIDVHFDDLIRDAEAITEAK